MDSSCHSESKCNSDFSIKRILGEATSGEEAMPSWLICTRYRPPRLPRSVSSTSRVRRSGRHARVPFTAAQAAALEAAYARAPYLAPPALRALAAALQLRDDRIKIWFQNRRARERREKCSTITPPQDVTLPPTSPQTNALQPGLWIPHTDLQQNPQISQELVQHMFQDTSIAIHLMRPSTSVQDEEPRDRCDSPLDVET
ncbi:PREDICTED: homeobox protein MSX-3-like [Papilio polytes]|uniref:homeobox protein MSX-3-like n=1 Tax=Papilio polytes TaxID=76194 RepID=UPI0006765D96|nr:PREDICTED: homeobox protein MSX-3-like [Papilio polytes]